MLALYLENNAIINLSRITYIIRTYDSGLLIIALCVFLTNLRSVKYFMFIDIF